MTSQELGDVLLSHWQNLWPLSPAERIKQIDEIAADLTFEEQMRLVTREMECA